ncbi:hypothetical protein KKF84_21370 [Myxococcota bacterium]|nr:hypothetical protein [Myxococcota bacterium]MBU1537877.1 hypothetical protein [Myxococcota bacterium]
MKQLPIRDLAICSLFGAAAWLLPLFFHLIQLGSLFMPMYLPLMVLPFMVGPRGATLTAFLVPLLSGAVTGMPPFFPPVAVFMSLELAVMAFIIASVSQRWKSLHPLWVLIPTLLLGRVLHVGMVMIFSKIVDLPARYMAAMSLLSGWPGVILMVVVIPLIVALERRMHEHREVEE